MQKVSLLKHIKCRNNIYPKSTIKRFNVPDDLISWSHEYPDYKPPYNESPILKDKLWADPPLASPTFRPQFNQLDGNVNRKSYCGEYLIRDGKPLNPFGRTGLQGRGILGRWGPNHAADPIVTRWKRDLSGNLVKNLLSGLSVLQMCAIKRHDCGEWAIPGGMVDPGEQISLTLKREFMEEALSTSDSSSKLIEEFFTTGTEVYKGYVDDPRNTDNAWMETIAVNFHDATGDTVGKFKLSAGDDAAKVKWLDIDRNIKLYASHENIIKKVIDHWKAHW